MGEVGLFVLASVVGVAIVVAVAVILTKNSIKKFDAQWKEARERAERASGWISDIPIYVDGYGYMAAGWHIEDGCLILRRKHVTHFANLGDLRFYRSPVVRVETVKIFARDQWKTVAFGDHEEQK